MPMLTECLNRWMHLFIIQCIIGFVSHDWKHHGPEYSALHC